MSYEMKKALTHYQCRPLVEENKELKKRIAELENKLIIARSFIPQKDLVNYSMKLDELKGWVIYE